MKKFRWAPLFCILLVFLLTACSQHDKPTESTPAPTIEKTPDPTAEITKESTIEPTIIPTKAVIEEIPLYYSKEVFSDPPQDGLSIETAYQVLRQSMLAENEVTYPLPEGTTLFYQFENIIRLNKNDAYIFGFGNETAEKNTVESRYAVSPYGMIYRYDILSDNYQLVASYDIATATVTVIENGETYQEGS